MDVFIHKDTEFQKACAALRRSGGVAATAAQQADAIIGRLRTGVTPDAFGPLTRHGENRIHNCFKYDLAGRYRLVTVQHDNAVWLLTVGNHEAVEHWIECHRGLRLVRDKTTNRLTPIYQLDAVDPPTVSYPPVLDDQLRLLDLLSKEAQEAFCTLSDEIIRLKALTVVSSLEDLRAAVSEVVDSKVRQIVRDVFWELREGRTESAEAHIRHATGAAEFVDNAAEPLAAALESSSNTDVIVNLRDIAEDQWTHLLAQPTIQDWMLFLHPDQKPVVTESFGKVALLRGVSGSGKTSVLLHRANELARKYPSERVLILTLNPALSSLLQDLVNTLCPPLVQQRIVVRHVDALCREILAYFEPDLLLPAHDSEFWAKLDELWKDTYGESAQQRRLKPIIESLEKRDSIDAERYIRDEFAWVRSAFSRHTGPREAGSVPGREAYRDPESTPRRGRSVPFSADWRQRVLDALEFFEAQADTQGLQDPVAISLRAHQYLSRLVAERPYKLNYRCILVDEVQDLGNVELQIVAAAAKQAPDGLFLSGDIRQQVFPKEHNLRAAGIHVEQRKYFRKNYRNPRQILEAAVAVVRKFDDEPGRFEDDIELLDPEYSARESAKPLVVTAETQHQEVEHIARLVEENRKVSDAPICIVSCSLREDDGAGMDAVVSDYQSFGLQVTPLRWDSQVKPGTVFVSALETVKGFEFSLVIISNCGAKVIPSPALPLEERWREARRLYVAMTRARDQLVFTCDGVPSEFLAACPEVLQWRSVRDEGLVRPVRDGHEVETLQTELERLWAENARLRKARASGEDIRVGQKGGVSVYGIRRFPVTLYKEQWIRVLAMEDEIRAFIKENEAKLEGKNKSSS